MKNLYKKHSLILPYFLVIPALLPLVLLVVFPAIQTIYMSFFRVTYGLKDQYVGLRNFSSILRDPVFQRTVLHTVVFTFIVVPGQLFVGLLAAIFIQGTKRKEKFYVSVMMTPYAVSYVVAIIIWRYLLAPNVGLLNYLLHSILGFNQILWAASSNQAWLVIILINIWCDFPFIFLIIYSSVISIRTELYESAYIDGATNWQAFQFIILPLIFPAITVATIFGFIVTFRSFTVVWLLTSGGPLSRTELISTVLYKQAFRYWEFGYASAIALVMTFITLIISVFYLRIIYIRKAQT